LARSEFPSSTRRSVWPAAHFLLRGPVSIFNAMHDAAFGVGSAWPATAQIRRTAEAAKGGKYDFKVASTPRPACSSESSQLLRRARSRVTRLKGHSSVRAGCANVITTQALGSKYPAPSTAVAACGKCAPTLRSSGPPPAWPREPLQLIIRLTGPCRRRPLTSNVRRHRRSACPSTKT
jgi:hypothetical protein